MNVPRRHNDPGITPRDIALRVLPDSRGRATPRPSSISRWRTGALIGVHLLMIAHVLHWWITGRSLGRFVLSDSMQTLEFGEINPGVILFTAALLTTALFGRFMCGWVCHIGALQDFSAWILRTAGVRPRLFRSRLLGYVPLGLAGYMFLWPTFHRLALAPTLRPFWPEASDIFAGDPFPGFSFNLTTDHLWDGLPSLWVAVPFLLVCGFLIVLFLGARGLCRYACPYGGFLLPAEQLAAGRVTVDMSKCDRCGLCTAACTTGVRVHDEVRIHGSVIDRNCIRSFDCIGACPTRALSFSLQRPAVLLHQSTTSQGLSRYDLTWPEEFTCAVIFILSFLTLRGLYQQFPLLMATPLAIIIAYLAWKTIRLRRDPNVTFARLQLRKLRSLTGSGRVFIAFSSLLAVFLIQSAVVRLLIFRAEHFDNLVTIAFDDAIAQRAVSDADRHNAATALRLYRLADSCWRSTSRGIGLAATPEATVRISWLEIVCGRPRIALAELETLRRTDRADEATIAELAILQKRLGEAPQAIAMLQDTVRTHTNFSQCRDLLASLLMESGRPQEADTVYLERLATRPTDAFARTGHARVLFVTGRQAEAISELKNATEVAPREPGVARDYALALAALNRPDDAVTELKRCVKARPAARTELLGLASHVLRSVGRENEAQDLDPAPRQ